MNKNYSRLLLLILLSFLSQFIGLLKTSILASNFGASIEMDAFNLINNISGTVFGFLTFGIATILVPNLVDEKFNNAVDKFIIFIYSTSLFLLLIFLIFQEQIIRLLTFEKDIGFVSVILEIATVVIIYQYLNTFLGLTNAVVQWKNKFNISKFLTIISSLFGLVLILFNQNFTIKYYSLVMLFITLLNLFLQIYLIREFFINRKIRFNLNFKDTNFRKLLKAFFPIAIGSSIYQISLSIDLMLASNLGNGMISLLNYAISLNGMIVTLIVGNIITYIYPKLAAGVRNNNDNNILFSYILFVNIVVSLVSIGIFTVGKYGISILYERGEFTPQLTEIVFISILLYSVIMPISAVKDLIYRFFYVHNDTYTPFKNSLLTSCLNILFSIILSNYFGLYGIILGTGLATLISLFTISRLLLKKYTFTVTMRKIMLSNILILLISIISLVIILFIKSKFIINNNILALFTYSILLVTIYFILIFICKRIIFSKH